MRGKTLIQLIRILGPLSRPMDVTKKELAENQGISRRSVSRSIQAIEEPVVPVYDDRIGPEREKTWATIQQIIDNPDGSIILTITSSVCRDIKRWVMSFGKEARLLEPENFKKDIQAELEKNLADLKEKSCKWDHFCPGWVCC